MELEPDRVRTLLHRRGRKIEPERACREDDERRLIERRQAAQLPVACSPSELFRSLCRAERVAELSANLTVGIDTALWLRRNQFEPLPKLIRNRRVDENHPDHLIGMIPCEQLVDRAAPGMTNEDKRPLPS